MEIRDFLFVHLIVAAVSFFLNFPTLHHYHLFFDTKKTLAPLNFTYNK